MVIIRGSLKPIMAKYESRAGETHCRPAKLDFGRPDGPLRKIVKHDPCLLFLLFINDLAEHTSSTVRLFADDCLMYKPVKTIQLQDCKVYRKTSTSCISGKSDGN